MHAVVYGHGPQYLIDMVVSVFNLPSRDISFSRPVYDCFRLHIDVRLPSLRLIIIPTLYFLRFYSNLNRTRSRIQGHLGRRHDNRGTEGADGDGVVVPTDRLRQCTIKLNSHSSQLFT